ncbi:MAG: flagellar M-ring protein FliF [Gammaproteobacteria bacterium]|nr:flagellar M-ring protein FliF [Gammaproteobacteria bacterium]
MADTAVMVEQTSPMQLLRQAGVLVAIAASVALGVYVVLWARTPNFQVLFTDLGERDVAEVMDTLQSSQIPYRINHANGAVLVASDAVHDARLKLAAVGLPSSSGMGFELLQQDQGFGTSQFIEQARYQRAVEGELARTIGSIRNVRSARVHLAMPRQTVFAREQKSPSASVLVDLYAGRMLENGHVASIVHLVAASVPNLPPESVTVVDQRGNLLSEAGSGDDLAQTAKRFEYTRTLEQSYIDRIENILGPIVGFDGVRAEVTADIDFTAQEQTRESWNPDLPAIRSEQTMEEEGSGAMMGGVPGALSNQPPTEASAPESTAQGEGVELAEGAAPGAAAPAAPQNRRSQSTRNYELDRTISHTRPSVGTIRRLSVAVVVRNPATSDAEAEAADTAVEAEAAPKGFAPEELNRLESLVKEAIGFDAARGDTVNVINTDFVAPPAAEPLPELPIWQQPWVFDAGKQALGGLFVLFLVFGVLRPVFRQLMAKPEPTPAMLAAAGEGDPALAGGATGSLGLPAPEGAGGMQALMGPGELNDNIEQVKTYVAQEPKVAAQVVKNWVGDE